MTRKEFDRRFGNHPLGGFFKAVEEVTEWRQVHICFISVKTTIHLLEYQGDLTKDEAAALHERLNLIVDRKLGKASTRH